LLARNATREQVALFFLDVKQALGAQNFTVARGQVHRLQTSPDRAQGVQLFEPAFEARKNRALEADLVLSLAGCVSDVPGLPNETTSADVAPRMPPYPGAA